VRQASWKVGVKWGVILGVAIAVWTMLLHVTGMYTRRLDLGHIADQVAIVLPVGALFLAIRERKRRDGGLTMKSGLATGTLAGIVSGVISGAFLWVYHHYINPAWLVLTIDWEQNRMRAAGATADSITARAEALRAGGTDVAQLTGAIVGSLVLSFVLSLIFSAILRTRRSSAAG